MIIKVIVNNAIVKQIETTSSFSKVVNSPTVVTVLTNTNIEKIQKEFNKNIVNADITNSKMVISHDLETITPIVALFNNLDYEVYPFDLRVINSKSIELDFTGLIPIIGTWRLRLE